MIPTPTNLPHCTQKYPAFSKKKESKAIQRRGNHNIISIFSFRCLNEHEEYNQISLLTVTHKLLQERETSFSSADNLLAFSPLLCVHCDAGTQFVNNLWDPSHLYLQGPASVGHPAGSSTRACFNGTASSLESPLA